jgi:hypothetical protein
MTTITCFNPQFSNWAARGHVHAGMLANSRVAG